MTLLWADGFEGYTAGGSRTVLDPVYDYVTAISTSEAGVVSEGRVSGKCAFITEGSGTTENALGHELDATALSSSTTWIIGMGVMVDFNEFHSTGESRLPLVQFRDSAGFNMVTFFLAGGNVAVISGGLASTTKIGFGTARLTTRVWHFIEMKVTFSTSSGAVEVRVNNESVLSASGVTAPTASLETSPTTIILAGSSRFRRVLLDDLYICDTAGSVNNNFLGEIGIRRLDPDADGTTSNFTALSGGNHWEEVDESDPDGDTSYIESSTVGHIDLFDIDDIGSTPAAIKAIQVVSTVKTGAGANSGRNRILSGATAGTGPTYSPTTSYVPYQSVHETDPATGVAWTEAGVNALEVGVEVVS